MCKQVISKMYVQNYKRTLGIHKIAMLCMSFPVSFGISVQVNQWRLRAVSKSRGVHKVDAMHSSFTSAIVHLKEKIPF